MPRQTEAKRRAHNIYVIELDKTVLDDKKFRDANPQYVKGKPCVYVGMTGRTPAERFEQHKSGYKAARIAKKYGVRLKPRLFDRFNPMTYEEACSKEIWRARTLRRKGYGVWQN